MFFKDLLPHIIYEAYNEKLVLQMTENLYRSGGGFLWHDVHSKFHDKSKDTNMTIPYVYPPYQTWRVR
jgi:hypothetical protein